MTSERRPYSGDAPAPSAPAADGSGGVPEPEASPRVVSGPGASPEADLHETEEQERPAADETPSDHEAKLEHDLEELAARAGKADEYLELAQRTKADFENYRRRSAREAAAAQQRGIIKLARELLPAVDDLDRAVAAAQVVPGSEENQDGTGTLVSGIKLVHAGVIAALARVGIEPYSPLGERFDPQHHEAVAQQPVQDADPGTIVEVYQRGYRLHDGSVLRPARVVVAA
ncbi:MAG TPA: nucleotide exchange factor GrpE [Solirubrobacteraceae bacterium]|nr:nucleotide exchange factor GrpE [Solirubrobacteraceae bacterium]